MPPLGNGVGWANVLATDNMVATYKGKVIVKPSTGISGPMTFQNPQSIVDLWIANNNRWSDILSNWRGGPSVDTLVYDNGDPITETVLYTDVPDDADLWIVLEPAFYNK